jgi:hypothetical protein
MQEGPLTCRYVISLGVGVPFLVSVGVEAQLCLHHFLL